jgi:murein DD-endopeptidase MepM/ murein hydrolase activator NlpD
MSRAWARWLMRLAEWRLLHHFLSTHRRTLLSARAARATLDHLPVPAAPLSQEGALWRMGAWRRPLPLRVAAHLLVLLLVLVVVATSLAQPPVAGVAADADVAQAPARRAELVDPANVPVLDDRVDASGDAQQLDVPAIHTTQALLAASLITTHSMREGESLNDVARQYGVSVQSLFWMNNLQKVELLTPGLELRIPRISGVMYTVQPGDTLESIAQTFHVAADAITLFAANNLPAGAALEPGRDIFIPGGTRPYPAEVLDRLGGEDGVGAMQAMIGAVVRESGTSLRVGPSKMYDRVAKLDAGRQLKLLGRHEDWMKVEARGQGQGWIRNDLLEIPPGVLDTVAETSDFPPLPPTWVWPTRGSITSPFGWRFVPFRSFHDGLDIANAAGTPIYAARAGRVIESGWCSGFGYCVKIDHGDGMVSIYGHMLRQPSVRVGQSVDAGDPIGLMGSTFDRSGGGYSTGVHLHFTIKINGSVVDPLKFLP